MESTEKCEAVISQFNGKFLKTPAGVMGKCVCMCPNVFFNRLFGHKDFLFEHIHSFPANDSPWTEAKWKQAFGHEAEAFSRTEHLLHCR